MLMIALSSKHLCDSPDVKSQSYSVTSPSDNGLCQTPTVTCNAMPLKVTCCIGTGLMMSNGDFKGPGTIKVACTLFYS